MTPPEPIEKTDTPADQPEQEREYDRTGFYPEEGKAFRIWALLGWLTAVVAMLAGAAAILNILLLEP